MRHLRLEVATLENLARVVPSRDGTLDPTEFAGSFGRLLDVALEWRTYQVAAGAGEGVWHLGDRMGKAGAGPRDVVLAYKAAIEARKDIGAGPLKVLVEEGRLLVLELMGHLVSYYRRNAVPTAPAIPAGRQEELGRG